DVTALVVGGRLGFGIAAGLGRSNCGVVGCQHWGWGGRWARCCARQRAPAQQPEPRTENQEPKHGVGSTVLSSRFSILGDHGCTPSAAASTWRAIGSAPRLPSPPCSTITAIAKRGFSNGAIATNQACGTPPGVSAVPVLAPIVTPGSATGSA